VDISCVDVFRVDVFCVDVFCVDVFCVDVFCVDAFFCVDVFLPLSRMAGLNNARLKLDPLYRKLVGLIFQVISSSFT